MTITVVIPNRNCGRFLDRCLASVYRQSVLPDELVLVDGHSSDNSSQVFEDWALCTDTDVSAEWISAPPNGIANARNIGIRECSGDVILPLDADDWIEPRCIELCLETFNIKQADVVAPALRWPHGSVQLPKPPFSLEAFLTGNRMFTCSMFSKKCWEQVGGYDESPRIYEDWLFWGSISAAGGKIEALNEPLYHYCPHDQSSCARMDPSDGADYRRNTVEKLRTFAEIVSHKRA